MAYEGSTKRQARMLKDQGLSNRDVARSLGVSTTTVAKWLAEDPEAEKRAFVQEDEEGELVELLAMASKSCLVRIPRADSAKDRSDLATAVDRLIGKYLVLTAGGGSEHDLEDDAELKDLLRGLVKSAPEG